MARLEGGEGRLIALHHRGDAFDLTFAVGDTHRAGSLTCSDSARPLRNSRHRRRSDTTRWRSSQKPGRLRHHQCQVQHGVTTLSNLSTSKPSPFSLRLAVAMVLVVLSVLFGSKFLGAAPAPTDHQTFGAWNVSCMADAMSDQKLCTNGSTRRIPYLIGATHLDVEVVAMPRGQKGVFLDNPNFAWAVTQITMRVDDGAVDTLACGQVNGKSCILNPQSRDLLLDHMESGKTLRIRMTIFGGKSFDFVYDLTGYSAAQRAFEVAASSYLN